MTNLAPGALGRTSLVPRDAVRPQTDTLGADWFEAPVCRNCGTLRDTPYCASCGQKAAKRFAWRDLVRESWDRLRFFELKSVKTLARLATRPGTVARNYVLGRRTRYMHPLTLLIALVAVLVLVLAANRYFDPYGSAEGDLSRMADRVMDYATWSFSLGIVAVFVGSWTTFRRRLGYNAVEHAVLAVYVQCIILAAIIVNMVPTLIWRDAAFVAGHRAASQYYLYAIKLVVVALAYRQFFLLDLRADWHRLVLACVVYGVCSWLLLRAYAAGILWLVTSSV